MIARQYMYITRGVEPCVMRGVYIYRQEEKKKTEREI